MTTVVYTRGRPSWLSRWRERQLFRKLPAAPDAYVLTVTGLEVRADSRFNTALQSAGEIRVMLANPMFASAQRRIDGLSNAPYDPAQLHQEIGGTIDHLRELRRLGKKVTLKFYDQQPFWKLVILGEFVWVQYCQAGDDSDSLPECVFALSHKDPTRGLFIPFYMHFLDMWRERQHPELDFDSDELVYRDAAGNELRRQSLSWWQADAEWLQLPVP